MNTGPTTKHCFQFIFLSQEFNQTQTFLQIARKSEKSTYLYFFVSYICSCSMPPLSSDLLPPLSSELLPALTFLSWPSGPHPWLRLLTTSPTELQIGRHTMPQTLIHQHNALTSRTPSLLFPSTSPSVHSLIFLRLSFILYVHVISKSSLQVHLSLL